MMQMVEQIGGVRMPDYFGRLLDEATPAVATVTETPEATANAGEEAPAPTKE